MVNCEMCGGEAELVDAIVEGTMLRVCRRCCKYGDAVLVEKSQESVRKPRKIVVEEITEHIVSDCGKKIKKAREEKGWKQEELARRMSERESIIHKVESGNMEPNFRLAQKFERVLKLKLVSNYQEPAGRAMNLKDNNLTIGDLVKIKEKRK